MYRSQIVNFSLTSALTFGLAWFALGQDPPQQGGTRPKPTSAPRGQPPSAQTNSVAVTANDKHTRNNEEQSKVEIKTKTV